MPLPDPAGVRWIHRLTLLASECLAELVEVRDGAIHAPLFHRVRVRDGHFTVELLGGIGAPRLAKTEKIKLGLGEAGVDVGDRSSLRSQGIQQGHVRNTKSAVVGGILAESQLAVYQLRLDVSVCRSNLEAAVLLCHAVRAFREGLPVFWSLPLADIAVAIVF